MEKLCGVNDWCCFIGGREKDSACPSPLALVPDSVGEKEKEYDRRKDCRSSEYCSLILARVSRFIKNSLVKLLRDPTISMATCGSCGRSTGNLLH